MTGSSGVHSPPSPKARSSVAYCKQYAALPDNAPRVLTKDSIHITRPVAAWPQRYYERRRLFQNVYQRYFQQILYGCVNARCETPTCLSHQRRVSQGPFRPFTVLSARSLATFLASQDNPEKGLCPHGKPAFLDAPKNGHSARRHARRNQTKTVKVEDKNLESFFITEDQPPEIRRHIQGLNTESSHESSHSHLHHVVEESRNNVSLREDPQTRKDPKSFSQNLFDTISMMVLQKVRVPNELGLSKWAKWIRGEGRSRPCERCNSISCEGCNSEVSSAGSASAEDVSYCHTPKSSGEDSVEWNDTELILEGNSALLSQAATKISSESYMEGRLSLDGQEEGSGTTYGGETQVNFEDPQTLPRSPRFIEDDDLLDTAMRSSIRPQTLSHFTSENIASMVSLIENASPIAHEERQFLQSLGRVDEPIKSTAFVRGDAMPRDLTYAYGIQSIISVLGNTTALLKSFRYPPVKSSVYTIQSVGFKEITGALRTLMEIDYHPSNVFPSLWNSVGSLYLPGPTRSKNPAVKVFPPMKARDPESEPQVRRNLSNRNYTSTELDTLNDSEAVHVAKIALAALVASVPVCGPNTWLYIQNLRASGKIAPSTLSPKSPETVDVLLEIEDSLDNELSLALMARLVKAVAARLCVSEISRNHRLSSSKEIHPLRREKNILEMILDAVSDSEDSKVLLDTAAGVGSVHHESFVDRIAIARLEATPQGFSLSVIVEWLRSILLREWDGKAEVPRWGVVGGALEFLSCIYRDCQQFKLDPEIFRTPSLSQRFDVMEMPAEWLSAPADRRVVHMLSYPFLFRPSTLVSYFRSINHAAMSKAFEASMVTARLLAELRDAYPSNGRGEPQVSDKIRRAMNNYLVLEIRRDKVLTDAMNQLWRRERRELLRPLKVRMGMEEGEEGVDHGGVQQEFFRVAIGEALNPDYGIFQNDAQTRMSWFQPCALEPLYKFEMLGLLTSLAIYNGLTLPITFPLAFYRKLLDLPVTQVAHIEDGWPQLAKGFEELLTWTDGDVEDVFIRSYVFSVEDIGSTINVEMDRIGRDVEWPLGRDHKGKGKSKVIGNGSAIPPKASGSLADQVLSSPKPTTVSLSNPLAASRTPESSTQESPRSRTNSNSSEASMVTNANRSQYVQDYIFWLTDKSIRPQYEAFARGFYTCLDRKATTIFTPEALKAVVEGIQEIDVDSLQQTTRYEGGFSAEHRVIKDFWHVVRQFSPEKLRLLLEFVTASDRIPVNGVGSILFVIQQNGTEDERLPTSLTCFGRLLLPAYSTRRKLREKLGAAIENSKGFGVA